MGIAKMALRVLSASRFQFKSFLPVISSQVCKMSNTGEWGSGAGKGGGAGGTIRDAGGAFGKREAAQEEEYFRRLQREQMAKLKSDHDAEIKYHEEQMKHHMEAIERHKKRATEIGKPESETSK